MDSSVNQSGSPSVTPSPSAENPLKFPSNNGEKHAVNYLHEIPVKTPSVCSLSVTSVIRPISAPSVLSVHPSDDKDQEILDEFPSTNYGEKYPAEIMAIMPDNVTLTLHNVKFLEKTPGNSNGVNFMVEFPLG